MNPAARPLAIAGLGALMSGQRGGDVGVVGDRHVRAARGDEDLGGFAAAGWAEVGLEQAEEVAVPVGAALVAFAGVGGQAGSVGWYGV